MIVYISKKDWLEATLDIKGRFYCPIDMQRLLLHVWPDNVKIKIKATKTKK